MDMDMERSIISCLNEKTRRPSISVQNSIFESRGCPSPSTYDSGNFSNCELLASSTENFEETNVEEKLDKAEDQNLNLIIAQQVIQKLKTELQYLSKSEKWYRNELKAQKKLRLDSLEKLYLKERDFLKTNQILELECQRLHALCDQSESKGKKERDLLLKQLKEHQNIADMVLQDIDKETTKYNFQKLNKIIEEHEALIDVLRKQKYNLLTDLHNITSERDEKIMLLEKKSASLEKENCMLVVKCKNLIIENQKLRKNNLSCKINHADNKMERLKKALVLCEIENSDLKFKISGMNKQSIEIAHQNNKIKELTCNICEKNSELQQIKNVYDIQKEEKLQLQNDLLKYKPMSEELKKYAALYKNCNEDLGKIKSDLYEAQKDVKIKRNEIENLEEKFSSLNNFSENLLSDFAILVKEIVNVGDSKLSNNNFESNIIKDLKNLNSRDYLYFKEISQICFDIIKRVKSQLDTLQEECRVTNIKNCELLSIFEDIIKIFDEGTIIAKIIFEKNYNDSLPKYLTFSVEETFRKNNVLKNLFLQKLEKSLMYNLNLKELNNLLTHFNTFVSNENKNEQKNINDINQSNSVALNHQLTKPNENKVFEQSSNKNMPEDCNQLKSLLILSQKEYEEKIIRHQAHVKYLISSIKSYKNKFKDLNNKYEAVFNKNQILEKDAKEKDKIEINLNMQNYNLKTEIANVKQNNERCQDIIKNLQHQLYIARIQFNEFDLHKTLNSNLTNNLTNLMDDYKTIIKRQENVCKSIKSTINYEKIHDLINKSNSCVPNLENVCQSIDDIRSDIKSLTQNNSKFQYDRCNLINANKINDLILRSCFIQERRKSLMDELEEASFTC